MMFEGGMTRAAFVRNLLLLRSNEPDWRVAVPIHAAEQISSGIESLQADLTFGT